MALSDYSSLEERISDAPEMKTLPRGTEVKARIINVRTGVDKNDLAYFMPVYDIPDEPLVSEFSDFFYDLAHIDEHSEKSQAKSLRKFKIFAEAFEIDYSKPFDFEDFVGLEGWLILGVSKSEEYGEQNSVHKYVEKK